MKVRMLFWACAVLAAVGIGLMVSLSLTPRTGEEADKGHNSRWDPNYVLCISPVTGRSTEAGSLALTLLANTRRDRECARLYECIASHGCDADLVVVVELLGHMEGGEYWGAVIMQNRDEYYAYASKLGPGVPGVGDLCDANGGNPGLVWGRIADSNDAASYCTEVSQGLPPERVSATFRNSGAAGHYWAMHVYEKKTGRDLFMVANNVAIALEAIVDGNAPFQFETTAPSSDNLRYKAFTCGERFIVNGMLRILRAEMLRRYRG